MICRLLFKELIVCLILLTNFLFILWFVVIFFRSHEVDLYFPTARLALCELFIYDNFFCATRCAVQFGRRTNNKQINVREKKALMLMLRFCVSSHTISDCLRSDCSATRSVHWTDECHNATRFVGGRNLSLKFVVLFCHIFFRATSHFHKTKCHKIL